MVAVCLMQQFFNRRLASAWASLPPGEVRLIWLRHLTAADLNHTIFVHIPVFWRQHTPT